MALFGTRKKQTFGQVPGMAPPVEQPMFGAPGQGMQQPEQQPAKFKPNILGVIGDAMQVFGGGQATYMQGVREQQERSELMRQRTMQAQQERETGWQDWVRKQEYERANPNPANNDTANDWDFWDAKRKSGVITEEQFNDKMFAPRFIVDPATGQTIKIGGAAPAKPVGKLTPIGGPASSAPGNFR